MTIKDETVDKKAPQDANEKQKYDEIHGDLSMAEEGRIETEENNAYGLEIKSCRFCLDGNESKSPLIAPCQCKGTAKWVHRHCLDEWRAHNVNNLAFSQCTVCSYPFQFQAVPNNNEQYQRHARRVLYWLLVSRDVLIITFLVQAFILFFALIFYFGARNEEGVIEWTDSEYNPACRSSGCQFWSCYAVGLLVLFLVMGLYGSVLLCVNDCSFRDAIQAGGSTPGRGPSNPRGGRAVSGQPVADGLATSGVGDCDCDCCGDCGGADCGSCESPLAFLVILAVVGAVLVVVGFVLAAVVAVVVAQLIARRHLWILEKQHLVQEYQVRDLSKTTDDSQRSLSELEADRLIRLGLMEPTRTS